jgi:hypothetical protein
MLGTLPRLLLVAALPELRDLPLLVPQSSPGVRPHPIPPGRRYRFEWLRLLTRLASRSTASPLGLRRSSPLPGAGGYTSQGATPTALHGQRDRGRVLPGPPRIREHLLSGRPLVEQARSSRKQSDGLVRLLPHCLRVVEIFQRGHFKHCFNRHLRSPARPSSEPEPPRERRRATSHRARREHLLHDCYRMNLGLLPPS